MELTYKQKTRLWFDHIETYQNKNICNLLENLKFEDTSYKNDESASYGYTLDNYEEGTYIPSFDTANNAFIKSLGELKLNKTYNALYDIVEGKTDRLTDTDAAIAEKLYTLLPPGTEIKNIKRGDDIEKEQWKKIKNSEEFHDYINTIESVSSILNLSHQGKKKGKK